VTPTIRTAKDLFGFPNPVNELAARVVATGVVVMCALCLALGQPWLLVPLAYGFWARVLSGPKLSPLGLVATRLVAPRLGPPRLVAGPPKRFAQAIGVCFSTVALVLWSGFGELTAAYALVGMLGLAASLEAFAGLCIGCRIFGFLAARGVVPEEVCEKCSNIALRHEEVLDATATGTL